MPELATGGYVSYDSSFGTISTLTDVLQRNNEKLEEALSKSDQHIDQLEEDIDYFNKSLEQQHELIELIENKADANLTMNIEQDKKIKTLEELTEFLKNYVNYLEGRIMVLEDKLNDKKVC